MNGTQGPSDPNFMNKLFGFIAKAEMVLLLLVGIGIGLNYVNETGLMFINVGLIGLAGVCFLTAYKPPVRVEQPEGATDVKMGMMSLVNQTIVPKLYWISCSVSLIGIMFYLNGLKGYQEMLMIGGGVLGVVTLVLGLSLATGAKDSSTAMPMLYRAIPVAAVVAYLLFANGSALG